MADYAQRTVSGALFGLTIYGAFGMVVLFQNRQKRLKEIEDEMRARGFGSDKSARSRGADDFREIPGTQRR